jgi:type I restriction enzyme M protein
MELSATLASMEWARLSKAPLQDLSRATREVFRFFESEDSRGLAIWKDLGKEAVKLAVEFLGKNHPMTYSPPSVSYATTEELARAIESIAREVAKLDGFDVTLRSIPIDQTKPLKAAKHWVVPVREWARNEEWQSADGTLKDSHDTNGLARRQYVEAMLADRLYDEKGDLKVGLLDPDCIEGREWNLSAGQYKPFDFTQLVSDKSVSQLIEDLRDAERHIVSGLDKLLAMVEGRQ